MGWFSGAKSDADPNKLRATLERLWPIIVAYSQATAACSGPPHAISTLPYPKAVIGDAILEWLTLLAKPGIGRVIAESMPQLADDVASAEVVESLIVQYLLLPYFIPDRQAQVMHQVAHGQFDGLTEDEIEGVSSFMAAVASERSMRESQLRQLGYPTGSEKGWPWESMRCRSRAG